MYKIQPDTVFNSIYRTYQVFIKHLKQWFLTVVSEYHHSVVTQIYWTRGVTRKNVKENWLKIEELGLEKEGMYQKHDPNYPNLIFFYQISIILHPLPLPTFRLQYWWGIIQNKVWEPLNEKKIFQIRINSQNLYQYKMYLNLIPIHIQFHVINKIINHKRMLKMKWKE